MDIKSGSQYPSCVLSNFACHLFTFDGVECRSMEGLLQSFKFNKPHIQVAICKLIGSGAKRRGQKRNRTWKRVQKLWWNGVTYDRNSNEYQKLLDRAYEALSQNENFQRALLATKDSSLTHSIGSSKKSDTCLTEREFCSRLKKIRTRLQQT